MSTPTTLNARAEVVGYPEPLLEAVRDLVAEVKLDPVLAFGSGQMLTVMKDAFAVKRDGRPSNLYGVIAALLVAAAEATVEQVPA